MKGESCMLRVNVFDEDGQLVGWFNKETAKEFTEDTRWDGHNHISRATGSQWDHEQLYRTAGGNWVLYRWSQWEGVADRYQFLAEDEARTWLLAQGHDAAAEEYFGPIPEECGPSVR